MVGDDDFIGPDARRGLAALLFLGAVVLIAVVPVKLFILYGLSWVRVFSVIVSSFLSLLLVVLYFRQSKIIDKQTELMKRDYQSSIGWKDILANGDKVSLKVINSGRGKVKRLFLKSEITSDTAGYGVDPGRVMLRNSGDGFSQIPSDSEVIEFEGRVTFAITDAENPDPERSLPFSEVSRVLSGKGIESVRLKLYLEVFDEDSPEGEFSETIEIVNQQLTLKSSESADKKGKVPPTTTLEESIESEYSTEQDINKTLREDALEPLNSDE